MSVEHGGESPDSSNTPAEEKQAMQRHYEHYKKLAENGALSLEDEAQWQLAQKRKASGLVD